MVVLVVCLLAVSLFLPTYSVEAQSRRCFPETGQCIRGRFRQYWEQNGGLAVLGYPTTAPRNELNRDTGKTYLTQWFKRNRFQLHGENAAPYDVRLGRLGDDRLKQLGLDWCDFPSAPAEADCVYFPQTRKTCAIRCLQLASAKESLALFGLPLTSAFIEPDATGSRQVVQWFEHARFE